MTSQSVRVVNQLGMHARAAAKFVHLAARYQSHVRVMRDAREDIAQAIERVRGDDGVLILTDMFGGTPSNLGMTFLEADKVEVLTGVNLPMLIKLASMGGSKNLLAVAREMRDDGRGAIWVASDLLRGEKAP